MNSVSRGVRNAFRSIIRACSIIIILTISIGLVIAMLAARQSVQQKITSIKQSVGTTISISPAGVRGFEGGGNPLTTAQIAKISSLPHVTKTVATLEDRLSSDDTSLKSGIEPGSLGNRNANNNGVGFSFGNSQSEVRSQSDDDSNTPTRTFTMPITFTGTNDVSAIQTTGSTSLKWQSGKMFDTSKDATVAAIGTKIASKNSLSVGSTFTAYGTKFTVSGIFDAGNTFGNDGVYIPLTTLQRLSNQQNDVTSVTATVDSSDNLASTTSAIKNSLGSAADVTSSADQAESTTAPLESVANIALFSLIGAVIAGAVIILLTMMMIVRERRSEIGVMKAIGASNSKIIGQFITEALTLTVIALITGCLVGVASATPITSALVDGANSSTTASSTTSDQPGSMRGNRFAGNFAQRFSDFGQSSRQAISNISASVGASTLLAGVGASLIIAILGSAIPALMISKIKPADAMRSE